MSSSKVSVKLYLLVALLLVVGLASAIANLIGV